MWRKLLGHNLMISHPDEVCKCQCNQCLFSLYDEIVFLKWYILYLSSCDLLFALKRGESINSWLKLKALTTLFRNHFIFVSLKIKVFQTPNLYFLARFRLTAHSSRSLVWCTAETVSRSKIWLYHQISIWAQTCSIALYWFLKLVQEAWNCSLQWISPG